tara:strand:+ start:301 stop:540 length:240 start_codon:yes stop_codon:yes gene_type:complete
MWNSIKNYMNKIWTLFWSKITVDEKAIATTKEIKRRYRLTKLKLSDMADAVKKVVNQIGDLGDLVKDKNRGGRKKQIGN